MARALLRGQGRDRRSAARGALDLAAEHAAELDFTDWDAAEHPRGPDGRFISKPDLSGALKMLGERYGVSSDMLDKAVVAAVARREARKKAPRNVADILAGPEHGDSLTTGSTFGTTWTFNAKEGTWQTASAPDTTTTALRKWTEGGGTFQAVSPEAVAAEKAKRAAARAEAERRKAEEEARIKAAKAAAAKNIVRRYGTQDRPLPNMPEGLELMPYHIEPRSFADVDWESLDIEWLHPQIEGAIPQMETMKRDMLNRLSLPLVADQYLKTSMPMLEKVRDNPVQHATTAEKFRDILYEGELKTGWEGASGTFGGAYGDAGPFGGDNSGYWANREALERGVFGIPEDKHREDPPLYGYIAGPDDPVPGAYGSVILTFKEAVDGRTTVTFGDSLNSYIKPTPKVGITDLSAQEVAESSAYYDSTDIAAIHREAVAIKDGIVDKGILDTEGAVANQPPPDYIEAQVYGDLVLADIAKVTLSQYDYNGLSSYELDKLAEHGIEVEQLPW